MINLTAYFLEWCGEGVKYVSRNGTEIEIWLCNKHGFDDDNSYETYYLNGEDLFNAFKAGYDAKADEGDKK